MLSMVDMIADMWIGIQLLLAGNDINEKKIQACQVG